MNVLSLAPLSGTPSAIANHLWQSTVFALAVWLLTLILRSSQARIRYALWIAASFKFLLPFSLLITLGSLLPQPTPAVSATPENIYSAVDFATQPFAQWVPTPVARPAPTPAERIAAYLPTILVTLWIAGTLAVLLPWFVRWQRLNATLRSATPAHTGREFRLLRRVEATLPARSPLPLRLSSDLIEPGIFGVFHPVLVWPERLTSRLEDEHIEAILTHELMHARRRDNLTAALHMLVESVLWFHPLVWWIGRRLLDERERACDEAVVLLGGRPEAYAESLLKACRFCIESPLSCVSGITGADLADRVRSIMTAAFATKLSPARKAFLATITLVILAVPIALGVVRLFPVSAQILHASGPLPSFEVATIRPWQPKPVPMVGDGTTMRPQLPLRVDPGTSHPQGQRTDQVQFIGEPILLIATAYNLQVGHENEIIGVPGWATQHSNRYELKAKIEPSKFAEMQKMTPAQQRDQVQLMEQSLLAERFKLKVHFETRNLPVYALVVTKGGAKLSPARGDEVASLRNTREDERGMETTATAVSLDEMSHSLILFGGKRVVDQTGLKGRYDFKLTWRSDRQEAADTPSSDAPVLSTALREQLGLQLVPSKAPVEVIVIDHIEQPSIDGGELRYNAPPPSPDRNTQVLRATGARPSFEVASIRASAPDERPGRTTEADRFVAKATTVKEMVMYAYGLGFDGELSGGPHWMETDRFTIEATPGHAKADALSKLSRDDKDEQMRMMVQSLLEDRFGLKVSFAEKQLPYTSWSWRKADSSAPGTTPRLPRSRTLPGHDLGGRLLQRRRHRLRAGIRPSLRKRSTPTPSPPCICGPKAGPSGCW